MNPKLALLVSPSEPFLNMAQALASLLRGQGVESNVKHVEAFCITPDDETTSVYVMSNLDEAWSLAATLVRLGVGLLNGEAQVCDLERRRWKADLTAMGGNTPRWMSSWLPGPLMANWPGADFPAYLKRGDGGRGDARLFLTQGAMAEYFQTVESKPCPWLVESALAEDQDVTKTYVIGDARNCFDLLGPGNVPSSASVVSLATLIQATTGLRFFSFDHIPDDSGEPSVIDVNRFPVYANKCWPEVAESLAAELMRIRRYA